MKVIIAGSRSITEQRFVNEAVALSGFTITEEVSGEAVGVDTLGRMWAESSSIPIKPFPVKSWYKDGKFNPSAGHERNEQMACYADALVAVWDGKSGGTADMIERMKTKGKPFFVYRTDQTSTLLHAFMAS